jgi:hypothetical protein
MRPRTHDASWWVIALAACWIFTCAPAQAQDKARPSILFNRWQEDWSVLADPAVPREPLDSLKYIALSPSDPKAYLSFGVSVRERFESNNAPLFGIGAANQNNNYLLSRSELHADLRPTEHFQIFVQLESDFAPWKSPLTPSATDIP